MGKFLYIVSHGPISCKSLDFKGKDGPKPAFSDLSVML